LPLLRRKIENVLPAIELRATTIILDSPSRWKLNCGFQVFSVPLSHQLRVCNMIFTKFRNLCVLIVVASGLCRVWCVKSCIIQILSACVHILYISISQEPSDRNVSGTSANHLAEPFCEGNTNPRADLRIWLKKWRSGLIRCLEWGLRNDHGREFWHGSRHALHISWVGWTPVAKNWNVRFLTFSIFPTKRVSLLMWQVRKQLIFRGSITLGSSTIPRTQNWRENWAGRITKGAVPCFEKISSPNFFWLPSTKTTCKRLAVLFSKNFNFFLHFHTLTTNCHLLKRFGYLRHQCACNAVCGGVCKRLTASFFEW